MCSRCCRIQMDLLLERVKGVELPLFAQLESEFNLNVPPVNFLVEIEQMDLKSIVPTIHCWAVANICHA